MSRFLSVYWIEELFFACIVEMQSTPNASNVPYETETIEIARTRLTETVKYLQDMFPNLNTAIIDRAIITTNGDINQATEKLLQISSKFS
jgi:hypothetical protein